MAERPFDMRGNRHLIIYGTADRPMVPTQSAPSEPVDEAAVAATPKCMEVRKFTWITPQLLREERKQTPYRNGRK